MNNTIASVLIVFIIVPKYQLINYFFLFIHLLFLNYSFVIIFCVMHHFALFNDFNLLDFFNVSAKPFQIGVSMDDFGEFSCANFDQNAFAARAIGDENVHELLRTVVEKIKRLDASICQHVSIHHQNLLEKVTEIDNLHGVLQSTENKISTLAGAMSVLKGKVYSQFAALESNVIKFRHFQTSFQFLKKINRMALLLKRIQSRTTDLAKSSAYISELDHLYSSTDWEGVHVLESYKRMVNQSREDMVSQAWNIVKASFNVADQAQLGLGLQIFQNLGMLMKTVCELVSDWQEQFTTCLSEALDLEKLTQQTRSRGATAQRPMGPGRASLPVTGGQAAASFYVAMWTNLDGAVDKWEHLLGHCRLLGVTLIKQRVSTTGNDTATGCRATDNLLLHGSLSSEPNPSLAELLINQLIFALSDDHTPVDSPKECKDLITLVFASVKEQLQDDLGSYQACKQFDTDKNTEHWKRFNLLSSLRSAVHTSEGFLGWAADRLAESLNDSVNRSVQIKEALEGEYPKLLKLILDLCRHVKLSQVESDASVKPKTQDVACLPECLRQALRPFETAYLSRSLSRLFDRVGMSFLTDNVAFSRLNTTELIDGIIQSTASELAYATVHYELLCKVSKNVEKTVALFATKVEGLVAMDSSATQVTDPPTSSQQQNIALINLLCEFGTQLELMCNRRLRNLPVLGTGDPSQPQPTPFRAVHDAVVSKLNSLCLNIMNPLLGAVGEAVEQILSTMHTVNFCPPGGEKPSEAEGDKSPYVLQLQEFLARVRKQYLQNLTQPSSSATVAAGLANISTLAAATNMTPASSSAVVSDFTCGEMVLQAALRPHLVRWTNVFMQHVTLVRPLNKTGRQSLAADCTEFEFALSLLLGDSSAASGLSTLLGPETFASLQALRCLLLAPDAQQIVDVFTDRVPPSDILANRISSLPASLVGQHLFSRAPDEIRSPHETAGWSKLRYVSWAVDRSNETERLGFLRNSLNVYIREVELRQQREYPTIYPLMRAFMNHFKNVDCQTVTTQNKTNETLGGT